MNRDDALSSIETPPDEPRQARRRGAFGHFVEGGLESSPLAIQIIGVIGSFIGVLLLTDPLSDALPAGKAWSLTAFIVTIAVCVFASMLATRPQVKKINRKIDSRCARGTRIAESVKVGVTLYPVSASVFGSGMAVAALEIDFASTGPLSPIIAASIIVVYLIVLVSDAIVLNRVLDE